jgi:hypothetical protein
MKKSILALLVVVGASFASGNDFSSSNEGTVAEVDYPVLRVALFSKGESQVIAKATDATPEVKQASASAEQAKHEASVDSKKSIQIGQGS